MDTTTLIWAATAVVNFCTAYINAGSGDKIAIRLPLTTAFLASTIVVVRAWGLQ